MKSKNKIISTALLCMALSPLTYAATSVSCTNFAENDESQDSYLQQISTYSPRCTTNGRIDVPNNSYVYATAVSTKNKVPFDLGSAQTANSGTLFIIRNVRWGRDSIYLNKSFSGTLNFKQKQTLGKTHEFFAKVITATRADLMNKPYVKVTLSRANN